MTSLVDTLTVATLDQNITSAPTTANAPRECMPTDGGLVQLWTSRDRDKNRTERLSAISLTNLGAHSSLGDDADCEMPCNAVGVCHDGQRAVFRREAG